MVIVFSLLSSPKKYFICFSSFRGYLRDHRVRVHDAGSGKKIFHPFFLFLWIASTSPAAYAYAAGSGSPGKAGCDIVRRYFCVPGDTETDPVFFLSWCRKKKKRGGSRPRLCNNGFNMDPKTQPASSSEKTRLVHTRVLTLPTPPINVNPSCMSPSLIHCFPLVGCEAGWRWGH